MQRPASYSYVWKPSGGKTDARLWGPPNLPLVKKIKASPCAGLFLFYLRDYVLYAIQYFKANHTENSSQQGAVLFSETPFRDFPETRFLENAEFPVNFNAKNLPDFWTLLALGVRGEACSRYWCANFDWLDTNRADKRTVSGRLFRNPPENTGFWQPEIFRILREFTFLEWSSRIFAVLNSTQLFQLSDNQLENAQKRQWLLVFCKWLGANWAHVCAQMGCGSHRWELLEAREHRNAELP